MPRAEIIAHRGASAYAREDTMPSFDLAVRLEAGCVEHDLHVTKDGELVCLHDRSYLWRLLHGDDFKALRDLWTTTGITDLWIRDRHRQGHRRPVGRRRRDELVAAVREPALEERLDRNRAAPHEPRSVSELRAQEIRNGTPVGRVSRGDGAGVDERRQRLTGCVGVARQPRQLRPSAVGPLLRDEGARRLVDGALPRLRPAEAEELKRAVLGR